MTTWKEIDVECKRVTGFHARDIANPLLSEELDPNDDAPYDDAATIVADLIGSTGDTNSRSAAAALVREMRQRGLTIEAHTSQEK